MTIAGDLRQQLASGELGAGAVLPSEADLAGAYGVSRVTVRKALEVLRAEGCRNCVMLPAGTEKLCQLIAEWLVPAPLRVVTTKRLPMVAKLAWP